jgi:hypothetical protein
VRGAAPVWGGNPDAAPQLGLDPARNTKPGAILRSNGIGGFEEGEFEGNSDFRAGIDLALGGMGYLASQGAR